jgi:hypothetical protein
VRPNNCPQGHEYTPENTVQYVDRKCKSGRARRCRICLRAHWNVINHRRRKGGAVVKKQCVPAVAVWQPFRPSGRF